jgi:hypothetical protein
VKWTEFFVGQGVPEDRTELRAERVDGFNSGGIHLGVPGTEHVTGATTLMPCLQSSLQTGVTRFETDEQDRHYRL